MKFCKTLQRAVEISDPSYVPYWTNYKRLKKLVKALIPEATATATAPGERAAAATASVAHQHQQQEQQGGGRRHDEDDDEQHHSQETTTTKRWESAIQEVFGERLKSEEGKTSTAAAASSDILSGESGHHQEHDHHHLHQQHESQRHHHRRSSSFQRRKKELESNPREVEFFELLHAEFSKASSFFDKAQQQFIIREEIVSVGMRVLHSPIPSQTTSSSIAPHVRGAVNNKHRWGLLSKAVFLLYRDLLLFEVFAIMTYFAFSKILKKHDKVTGYHTRGAFMVNVVNKANFTTYPKIFEMIQKCEELYNDASESLLLCLYEDERLFLHMINEWNIRLRQPIRGAVEDTRSLDPPVRTTAAAAASALRHVVPTRVVQERHHAVAGGGVLQGGEEEQQQVSSRGVLPEDDNEDHRDESESSSARNRKAPATPPPSPDSGARRILFPPSHPKFRAQPAAAALSRGSEESESKKPASKKPRKSPER